MEWPDPASWNAWIWLLHGLGVIYVLGFLVAWIRFRARQRAVDRGDDGAVDRFNSGIRGVPWAFYAKMLGRHALLRESDDA